MKTYWIIWNEESKLVHNKYTSLEEASEHAKMLAGENPRGKFTVFESMMTYCVKPLIVDLSIHE